VPRAPEAALTAQAARRLAVARQALSGPRPAEPETAVEPLVRQLGCLQRDPIAVVARSHMLVLWSRLGALAEEAVDRLLYDERLLFEYWAHQASIVPVADWALHEATLMRAGYTDHPGWREQRNRWIEANHELRDHVLAELDARGPLAGSGLEDRAREAWRSTGWTGGRSVDRMLTFLWTDGRVAVAGRRGRERLWHLMERWLPDAVAGPRLDPAEAAREAAQRALRALGVATPAQIRRHFVRDRYGGLETLLAQLVAEGRVLPAAIDGVAGRGQWYLHADDLPLVEQLADGTWGPRTELLSPFDNLLCDRERTQRLFGFDFKLEIYVPQDQRRDGYYVLPILHGDELIGRLDAAVDRRRRVLVVKRIRAEEAAPRDAATGRAIAGALERLAAAAGARGFELAEAAPRGWGRVLRRRREAATP
jgi:uncharacterized protein